MTSSEDGECEKYIQSLFHKQERKKSRLERGCKWSGLLRMYVT